MLLQCLSRPLVSLGVVLLQLVLLTLMYHMSCGPHSPEGSTCLGAPDARGVCARHRRVNAYVTDYDVILQDSVRRLVTRQVSPRDPEVSAVLRQMMDPPAVAMPKHSMKVRPTPQNTEIVVLTKAKRGGFFMECGALDGERSSNSLWLEHMYGWSGLLVEVDPYFYTQLRGKNRRAYSINACLSTTSYPAMMDFRASSAGTGRMMDAASDRTSPAPCFPLEAMLLALGQTTVDYLSLDVEGQELAVLKTIPFDRLDIRTLSVEYAHSNGSQELLDYMAGSGYKLINDLVVSDEAIHLYVKDYIFMKTKKSG